MIFDIAFDIYVFMFIILPAACRWTLDLDMITWLNLVQ